jgi:hypothetical protein
MIRRGRRLKKPRVGLKERRRYSKLKYEALYHTLWRIRPGRGYWHLVRQPTKLMSTKCQHVCPESKCVLLEKFIFSWKPEKLPFWPTVRYLYSLKQQHAMKTHKEGDVEHHESTSARQREREVKFLHFEDAQCNILEKKFGGPDFRRGNSKTYCSYAQAFSQLWSCVSIMCNVNIADPPGAVSCR